VWSLTPVVFSAGVFAIQFRYRSDGGSLQAFDLVRQRLDLPADQPLDDPFDRGDPRPSRDRVGTVKVAK
jgi:hypothetical protein